MEKIWDINNRKCSLHITIKCQGKCEFRVIAEDLKPNSKYSDRVIKVDGSRTVYIPFPVSPKKVKVKVTCTKSETPNKDFIVGIEEKDLVHYEIHVDETTQKFFDVLVPFAQQAGFTDKVSPKGVIWEKNGFNIRYYTQIRDHRNGKVLNTPARVGHSSKVIDFSKQRIDGFTVPARIAIGAHEYSHVYKNPQAGLEIDNEMGADIFAIYYCLGFGFSKVEIIHVFANVFYYAQTNENIARMRKIMDYIKRFENGEFAKKIG